MKNFKKILLLAGFAFFADHMPIQASDVNKPEQTAAKATFIDTAPIHIMKWSGAAAAVIICGAAIYYVPSILKNLHDATEKLNTQTVPALTNIGDQITKDTGSIVNIVADFSEWLKGFFKDPLTFNFDPENTTLNRIARLASGNLPPHAGF